MLMYVSHINVHYSLTYQSTKTVFPKIFPELPSNTAHFACLLNKTQLIQLNSDPELGVLDKGHMH